MATALVDPRSDPRPWWRRVLDGASFAPAAPLVTPQPEPRRARVRAAAAPPAGGSSPTSSGAAPLIQVLPTGGLARTGRQTRDAGHLAPGAILPPDDPERTWRIQSLDEDALRTVSPAKLMALLADLSPDVSRALYDFLRMCNSGWTIKAKRASGATAGAAGARRGEAETDDAAQAALDAMLARLGGLHGNLDVLFNRFYLTAWLRGAFFAEAVFDGDYQLADLTAPDPITVRFRRQIDPIRGTIWQLGQMPVTTDGAVGGAGGAALSLLSKLPGATPSPGLPAFAGGFTPLDTTPAVCYVPVDPFPGSPYGRPLCSPALFTTLFLLGMLHDLRRVIAQQGYPRLDVSLMMEQLRLTMPPDEQDDPKAVREWVEGSIKQVQDAVKELKPDDTYVHTDVVQVNRPVGTVDANSLGGIDAVIKALERMATRALKTMPLSMGNTEGISEANATRQWELQVAGIKAFQHLCEGMLERLFGLALQLAGVPAVVEVRFAELRAAEELRDEQVRTLRFKNWRQAYDNGWCDNDEAAMATLGHAAVEQEPRAPQNADLVAQAGNDPAEQGAMKNSDKSSTSKE